MIKAIRERVVRMLSDMAKASSDPLICGSNYIIDALNRRIALFKDHSSMSGNLEADQAAKMYIQDNKSEARDLVKHCMAEHYRYMLYAPSHQGKATVFTNIVPIELVKNPGYDGYTGYLISENGRFSARSFQKLEGVKIKDAPLEHKHEGVRHVHFAPEVHVQLFDEDKDVLDGIKYREPASKNDGHGRPMILWKKKK